jgi:hypothetical protein
MNLGQSFAFSAALSVSVRPNYAVRTEVLYNFCIILYMSQNPYLLELLSSPQIPSFIHKYVYYLEFASSNWSIIVLPVSIN